MAKAYREGESDSIYTVYKVATVKHCFKAPMPHSQYLIQIVDAVIEADTA